MRTITIAVALVVLIIAASTTIAQVGALDTSFDGDGRLVDDFGPKDFANDVVINDVGEIFVVGSKQSSGSTNTTNALLVRYSTDGSFIDQHAFWETPCGDVPEAFWALRLDTDGTLVAGGYSQFDCSGPQRDFWVLRIDQEGTELDRFDRPNLGLTDLLVDLAIQDDGKVVGVGSSSTTTSASTWDLAVVRWNADGTVDDAGFGSNGMVKIDVGGDSDRLAKVAVCPDGDIIAGGYATQGGQTDIVLLRLDEAGVPVQSFGTDGLVTTDFFGFTDSASDLHCLPGGKVVVAGSRGLDADSGEPVVLRYNVDGSIDTEFGTAGVAALDFGGPTAGLVRLVRQLDRKLVVVGVTEVGAGGDETRDIVVARLMQNGSLDSSFNGTGFNVVDMGMGQLDRPQSAEIQADGDILIVGYTQADDGSSVTEDFAIARFIGDTGTAMAVFLDDFESGDTTAWSVAQ